MCCACTQSGWSVPSIAGGRPHVEVEYEDEEPTAQKELAAW